MRHLCANSVFPLNESVRRKSVNDDLEPVITTVKYYFMEIVTEQHSKS